MLVQGNADVPAVIKEIAEGNVNLILHRGIEVTRGVVSTRSGDVYLLIPKFRNESQHLTQGRIIPHIDETAVVSEALTFSERDTGYDSEPRRNDGNLNPGSSPMEKR